MSWKICFLFFEVVAIFWSQNPNVLVFWFCSSLEISMLWFCTSLASFSFSSDHQRNIVSILAHLRTHALCTIYDYIINNHLLGACGQITLTLISLGDRNPHPPPRHPSKYILLYSFFVTHANFMKFGEFS